MIVDNTELIKKLMTPCKEGEFYMLMILHRAKDGKTKYEPADKKISQQTIKTYYISSPEYLDYKMNEIKDMCEMFNARAVINLNKKSWKQITLKGLEIMAGAIAHEEWKSIKSVVDSACGQTGACDKDKSWIVDVDTKDEMELAALMQIVDQCKPIGIDKIKGIIPTVHGFHIISKPFDKEEFRKLYEKPIDLHDNNPTLLYYKEVE